MIADYFYWQYVWSPRWLLQLMWNLQRSAMRIFSIPIMLRTLLAPWHKDIMKYRGGSLESYFLIFTWNIVSRLIGFLIRISVIISWLAVEAVFIPLAVLIILLLFLWPGLVLLTFATGFTLLFI